MDLNGFHWIAQGRFGAPLHMEKDNRAKVKSHFRDAGGRMGDCKIACLNTTGVPIL